MKKSTWIPLLLLPLCSAFQADDGPADRARARATAKTLAEEWPTAVYTIQMGRREIGYYIQSNRLAVFEGDSVLEFSDVVAYPKSRSEFKYQYVCAIDPWFDTRAMAGQNEAGRMKIAFADGRATGAQMGQVEVDVEIPERFVTDVMLLRRLLPLANDEGAELELDYVNLEGLPQPAAISSGTLLSMGGEELEIEGETYPTWCFSWTRGNEKPVFLWYGEHGQLLRRREGIEIWTWSPTRTRDALANAGIEPPPPSKGK